MYSGARVYRLIVIVRKTWLKNRMKGFRKKVPGSQARVFYPLSTLSFERGIIIIAFHVAAPVAVLLSCAREHGAQHRLRKSRALKK